MYRLCGFSLALAGRLMLLVMASVAHAQSPTDVLNRDYFREALRLEIEAPPPSLSAPAVFLGDSIIANLHPELHISGALNYGVPGDTTPGILYRLRKLTLVRSTEALIIQGGINDLGFGRAFDRDTIENFRKMIAEAPPTARLIVIGPLPVDERVDLSFAGYNARIRAINFSVAGTCLNRPRCWFIDGSALRDRSGNLDPVHHRSGDAVHLNDEGNRRLLTLLPQIFR